MLYNHPLSHGFFSSSASKPHWEMGDPKLKTLSMARRELEELYLGIPDESVNLTFEHLAVATSRHQKHVVPSSSAENRMQAVDPDSEEENKSKLDKLSSLNKFPSLDFSKAMQASRPNHYHHHQHPSHVGHDDSIDSPTMNYVRLHHHIVEDDDNDLQSFADDGLSHGHRLRQSNLSRSNRDNNHHDHHYMDGSNGDDHHHRLHHHQVTPPTRVGYSSALGFKHGVESMTNFDDLSGISIASNVMNHRRRPGIPHSSICTLCTTYIYIFRHRCLVCGRVYCRNCVSMGMGEMSEGRKCVECLGKRFSQRYIQRAGKVGCWSRYPAKVKQAELKWADKGPRGSGDERGYGSSVVTPTRSRSPVPAWKGNHSATYNHSNPPSFVTSTSFSPLHTLPF